MGPVFDHETDDRPEHKELTHRAVGPVCDHVSGTDNKISEVEICKLLLPCLKPIVGNKCDGSIIPETRTHTHTHTHTQLIIIIQSKLKCDVHSVKKHYNTRA